MCRRLCCLLTLLILFFSPEPGRAASDPSLSGFESFRDSGEKAFAQNNYGLAEKNFLSALKAAELADFPAKDPRWAQLYKNLASLYEVRSQFAKSEMYLEKELRAKEKSLGSENPQVLALVAKLCRSYLNHNNQAKGERLSGLLMNYAGRIQKEEELVDKNFDDLHKFFAAHSEFLDVGKKLKSVRESADRVRADDHLELAANLDSIASIYKEKGKFALAEQIYKRSLELREKTLAPGHQALAFAHENLGNLYSQQGKTQFAQAAYEQSMEITRKSLDFKRPEVYTRLDNLARSYVSLGQYQQAESLYKQALALIKENCGQTHKDYGAASQALASLYIRQAQYAKAEPLLKSALKISESLNGPQSASLLSILEAYAEALERNGHHSESAKLRQRANLIRGNASASASTEF